MLCQFGPLPTNAECKNELLVGFVEDKTIDASAIMSIDSAKETISFTNLTTRRRCTFAWKDLLAYAVDGGL
jgi:hypothetical protein